MAEELGWSEAEQLKQKEEALSFLRTQMGKDLNKASVDSIPVSLTKAEIAEYVNRFNSLDGDKKGFVSINDIRKSLQVGAGGVAKCWILPFEHLTPIQLSSKPGWFHCVHRISTWS